MLYTGKMKPDVRISATVTKDGVEIPLGQVAGKGRSLLLRYRQWKIRRELKRDVK